MNLGVVDPTSGLGSVRGLMAVGCVLLPFASCWWFGFCLGAYALDYLEEKGEVGEPGWAVPPGVARVGHVSVLGVGFRVHQAAYLDAFAFGAPAPDVQALAGGVGLDPGFAGHGGEQHLSPVGQVAPGVVAVVQVDAGEPAAQGEAQAVPGRGLLGRGQAGPGGRVGAGCRCPVEAERLLAGAVAPVGQPPAQPPVGHGHVRGHRHPPARTVGPLTAGVRAEPASATSPGMLRQYLAAELASCHALIIS